MNSGLLTCHRVQFCDQVNHILGGCCVQSSGSAIGFGRPVECERMLTLAYDSEVGHKIFGRESPLVQHLFRRTWNNKVPRPLFMIRWIQRIFPGIFLGIRL